MKLARLHRAGELTAVHVPDAVDEAMRDLCRARTDAVQDLRRTRAQLKAFLLRHGYRYSGKSAWTEAHRRYLRELVLPHPAHRAVLEDALRVITASEERIARLEEDMAALLEEWAMKPVVQALMGLRGSQLVGAMVMVSELGGAWRFAHPRQLMAYLGLVPTESSSGGKRTQGGISKCGNSHARWLMLEASHHYRLPPKVSKELSARQEGLSEDVKKCSWHAQTRPQNDRPRAHTSPVTPTTERNATRNQVPPTEQRPQQRSGSHGDPMHEDVMRRRSRGLRSSSRESDRDHGEQKHRVTQYAHISRLAAGDKTPA